MVKNKLIRKILEIWIRKWWIAQWWWNSEKEKKSLNTNNKITAPKKQFSNQYCMNSIWKVDDIIIELVRRQKLSAKKGFKMDVGLRLDRVVGVLEFTKAQFASIFPAFRYHFRSKFRQKQVVYQNFVSHLAVYPKIFFMKFFFNL